MEIRAGGRGQAARYPGTLRVTLAQRPVRALKAGRSLAAVAWRLGIAPCTLERWIALGTGATVSSGRGGRASDDRQRCDHASDSQRLSLRGADAAQAVELLVHLEARQ